MRWRSKGLSSHRSFSSPTEGASYNVLFRLSDRPIGFPPIFAIGRSADLKVVLYPLVVGSPFLGGRTFPFRLVGAAPFSPPVVTSCSALRA